MSHQNSLADLGELYSIEGDRPGDDLPLPDEEIQANEDTFLSGSLSALEPAPAPAPASATSDPAAWQASASSGLDRSLQLAEQRKEATANPPGREGPAHDTAVEAFRRHGIAIHPSDDIYIVAHFLTETFRRNDAQWRADWRRLVDDAITPLHDVREEIKLLSAGQQSDISRMRAEIHSAVASVSAETSAEVEKIMQRAQERADAYVAQMAEAAQTQFRTSLRELVASEVRVAMGKAADAEIEVLRAAARDATAAFKHIVATQTHRGPHAAGVRSASNRGVGILAELQSLSQPAQIAVGALALMAGIGLVAVVF